MIFDSHAHYDDHKFDSDRDELLSSMKENGVGLILNASDSLKTSQASVRLTHQYDFIYAAVGIHPHHAKDVTDEVLAEIEALSSEKKVVAIGEIGLDYYYDLSPRDTQKYWFQKQLKLANRLRLPVIIHDRDAHGDCMDILKKETPKYGGILHSFSGSLDMAKEVLALGMDISISGPVTYKNNKKTVDVAREIPLEHLLIETDAPYLPPEPHRGERNSSLFVKFVAQKIADVKCIPFEDVCQKTYENAKRVFRIS